MRGASTAEQGMGYADADLGWVTPTRILDGNPGNPADARSINTSRDEAQAWASRVPTVIVGPPARSFCWKSTVSSS